MYEDDEPIAVIRLRSYRFVQTVFVIFTLTFAALGLAAHHAPGVLPLSSAEPKLIADSFLFLASAYALTLFVWDWVYGPHD